jgi:hypothetical protein
MIREWRHLKMLKRSGYGHLKDEVGAQSHSYALLCPACPHPGINLPPNWEDAPKEKGFDSNRIIASISTDVHQMA